MARCGSVIHGPWTGCRCPVDHSLVELECISHAGYYFKHRGRRAAVGESPPAVEVKPEPRTWPCTRCAGAGAQWMVTESRKRSSRGPGRGRWRVRARPRVRVRLGRCPGPSETWARAAHQTTRSLSRTRRLGIRPKLLESDQAGRTSITGESQRV